MMYTLGLGVHSCVCVCARARGWYIQMDVCVCVCVCACVPVCMLIIRIKAAGASTLKEYKDIKAAGASTLEEYKDIKVCVCVFARVYTCMYGYTSVGCIYISPTIDTLCSCVLVVQTRMCSHVHTRS